MSYRESLVAYILNNIESPSVLEYVQLLIRQHDEQLKKDVVKEIGSVFTWGKFKGRQIAEVFSEDKDYCEWFSNHQYCSRASKKIIDGLLNE